MNALDFAQRYGDFAVIAGGSDGLGLAFAGALARRGVNLVLIARQKQRLETAAQSIRAAHNVEVVTIAADLADSAAVISQLDALNLPVGLLVYNAAYAPIGLFEEVEAERLALAAAVNVNSPLLLAKHLSRSMLDNGRGGIILMSSLAGTQGSPRIATYAATKSFNAVLAEGLWAEMKPRGVDVLACCAGAILTPGYSQAKTKTAPGTLTADAVAEAALRALGKKPVVVPGAVNKIGRFVMMRLLSRKAAVRLMHKNTANLHD